jgi:phosphoribosylformimino-5-aminoimidazole carboxamide ribonucleotide (ProFAR) isomerase
MGSFHLQGRCVRKILGGSRQSQDRTNDAVWESQEAKKLFGKFKKQIEATDLALYKKDEKTADALLQQAATSFSSWLEVVGIQV